MKDYAQFISIKNDPELREIFGEDWIESMDNKINRIEKGVKEIEKNGKYMTPQELEAYAETLYN